MSPTETRFADETDTINDMEKLGRSFIGGLENLNPKHIAEREKIDYQVCNVIGLTHDYINTISGLASVDELYTNEIYSLDNALEAFIEYSAKLESYDEYLLGKNRTTNGRPLLAASNDIRPHIDAINEIVADIKNIGTSLAQQYAKGLPTEKKKTMLERAQNAFSARFEMLNAIVRGESNSWQTGRTQESIASPVTEEATLRRIKERIIAARRHLQDSPSPNSFSHIHNDDTVTPIGWVPTDEDKKKIEGA